MTDTALAVTPDLVPLKDPDLMQILGLHKSRFYLLKKRGAFTFLEMQPAVPGMTRYSRYRVEKWLRGELHAPGAPRKLFGRVG